MTDINRAMARHPRSICFLARLEGKAVGAAGLEISGLASALFATSVESSYRKRGIQQALIARRLGFAFEHGAKIACIHSRPNAATERNAARLGFFLAYPKAVLVLEREGLLASP